MIRRIALLVVTIFVLSVSAPALAAEPGSGTIEGWLVNGTKGGSSVADQDITLKTYFNDAEVSSTTTRSDAEGRFLFDGLSTEPGYSYQVVLTFQQAEYYSRWLGFDEGETSKSVEVTVYDSTTSDEAIKVQMAHMIVYVEEGTLLVKEYFLFVNESDRTYIGSKEITTEGDRETLRFSLPDKATELQPGYGLMECCIVSSEEGFVDTMPILPGGKDVAYSYKVDYNSGTYTFSRNVNYTMARYDFLFQGEGIKVTSDQLVAEEPMNIEGTQFNHLSGRDFVPGDILVAQLSGLPETNNQEAVMWAVLALIVLTCGFSLTYLLRKKRVQPLSPEDSLEQKRQRLLVELAQLDDDFEGGKIPEEVYHRLRAVTKAQLVELIQRSKGESGRR